MLRIISVSTRPCAFKIFALLSLPAVGVVSGALTGCSVSPAGSGTACSLISVMTPSAATADHAAAYPANSATFGVGFQAAPGSTGCAVPQIVRVATLMTSDTVNVTLPSAGVATCVGATTVPAVLTDTASKATATLTCK